ncbi:thiamine phosphate synthase [Haloferula chungangensis]|uniref:Thiamine-phosphate synthase n=1 Tax=Haloferula chungangensis TaxID=1048331 RepID=A0ABW2LC62_9BACT
MMTDPRKALADARLYGILDLGYVTAEKAEEATRALLKGGVDLLQLRAKTWTEAAILELGKKIAPLCKEAGVPFVMNDFPSLAIELDADALHLGQDDGSLEEARKLVGDQMLLGRSTHSPEQARQALLDGFDYIGFGPLFPTPTKLGRPGIGMDHVRAVQADVGIRIPVFCIGGIRRDNLAQVIEAGARRVVIVSDLLTAPDIATAVAEVQSSLRSAG